MAAREQRLRMKRGVTCLALGVLIVFGGATGDLRIVRTFRVRSGSARVSRKEVA
jgi:hypothetical protein